MKRNERSSILYTGAHTAALLDERVRGINSESFHSPLCGALQSSPVERSNHARAIIISGRDTIVISLTVRRKVEETERREFGKKANAHDRTWKSTCAAIAFDISTNAQRKTGSRLVSCGLSEMIKRNVDLIERASRYIAISNPRCTNAIYLSSSYRHERFILSVWRLFFISIKCSVDTVWRNTWDLKRSRCDAAWVILLPQKSQPPLRYRVFVATLFKKQNRIRVN